MTVYTASISSRASVRRACGMVAWSVAMQAFAEQLPRAPGSPVAGTTAPRGGFLQVFDRLDTNGVVLLIAAGVILLLLVLRIWAMVRRERRPIRVPQRPRVAPKLDDEPALDRATMRSTTDWGHDENVRGAPTRAPVALESATTELPSLDQAVTQWTISEVQRAAVASKQPLEVLGKPTHLPASPYRTAFNPYFRGDATHSIEVVEVADTLLQAELLVQLGDPKQAMTLLSNHIRETEKPGPAVWLMLLNLYQATGRKSQYEALSVGFGTLFNAAVPPWPARSEDAAHDIENYPQVMMKLHTTWGTPAARPLIEGLLNDDRGGSRQGFSLTAYRDLLFLVEILNEIDKMAHEDEEREGIQRKLGRTA